MYLKNKEVKGSEIIYKMSLICFQLAVQVVVMSYPVGQWLFFRS